jgi:hypothetical protein
MSTITYVENISGFSAQVSSASTYTGTGMVEVRESISTGVTDGVLNFASDISTIKFFWLKSDQALTLKTYNASAVLVDTIAVAANTPIVYSTSIGTLSSIFTADFASCKVTNASGSTASLTILMLTDCTP